MKRFAVPVLAGVVVFGAVSAFAATLTVSSTTLGSGDSAVASCNATAAVSYTSNWDTVLKAYEVSTAPITSAVTCAGKSYKVTLTGTGGAALAEITGVLDVTGAHAPDFSAANVLAANVTGVAVLVTG